MSEEKSTLGTIVDTLLAPQDTSAGAAPESGKLEHALERMTAQQDASASATLGKKHAGDADERVAMLEAQVKQLERNLAATALYCRAILQVLHERGITSPEKFRQHFDRLDMLDGVKDGR